MATQCIFCGGACGRVCRGLGFKGSDGGGEKLSTQTRKEEKPELRKSAGDGGSRPKPKGANCPAGVASGPSGANPRAKAIKGKTGMAEATAPRKTKQPPVGIASRLRGGRTPQGPADAKADAAPAIRKRGRPRVDAPEIEKPWVAAGLTERTWYRRQKEARGE